MYRNIIKGSKWLPYKNDIPETKDWRTVLVSSLCQVDTRGEKRGREGY